MALRAAEPDKVLALPDPSFTQAADAEEMKLKLVAILCDLSDRLPVAIGLDKILDQPIVVSGTVGE